MDVKIIKKYKRVPIVSIRDTDTRRLGYIVSDKYKIMEMPFHYPTYMATKDGYEYVAYCPYCLTNDILKGLEITSDQDIIDYIDRYNNQEDPEWSKMKVKVLIPNKKWEIEDDRWKDFDTDYYDTKGKMVCVTMNKFTLEIIQ